MGCQQSQTTTNEKGPRAAFTGLRPPWLNNGRPKSLTQNRLSQETLNYIWDLIRQDRLPQFALMMEQHKIPPNIQISQPGLWWSIAHFAAKFNSYRILELILTEVFFQMHQSYVDYVNAQNCEGQTAIHLAALEGAEESFQVLWRFGGIDLGIKNGIHQSLRDVAGKCKRTQIVKKVDILADMGIFYLQLHQNHFDLNLLVQALKEDPQQAQTRIKEYTIAQGLLTVQIQKNQVLLQQKQKTKKAMDELHQKQLENTQMQRQVLQNQMKKQLNHQETQKKRLQSQKQKINSEDYVRKKLAMEQAQKKQLKELQMQHQQQARKQKQKLLMQKLEIEKQLQRKKREDIQKQKKEDQQKNQQRIRQQTKQKMQDIKKQQKLALESEKIAMAQKMEKKQNQVKQIKVKDQDVKKPNQKIFGECPKQLRQQYESITTNFTDQTFPHQQRIIGKDLSQTLKNAVWLRPKEIFKSQTFQLFQGIDPNDILQGSLGVCYYLAAISCLTQRPQRIRNMFVFADYSKGFYVLRFYTTGKPTYITVDDYFPCHRMTRQPLFARPREKQTWVMLLQKAWVKQFGSYLSAESMSPDTMMQNLTGAPALGIWTSKHTYKQLFDIMLQHDKDDSIMVLTSCADKKIPGIVAAHAYSLISVHSHNGHNLYKIRNPHGKLEWEGQYSDKSQKWTEQLKKAVGFEVAADDGVFFMSEDELTIGFVYISVGVIKKGYVSSWYEVKQSAREEGYYEFIVGKEGPLNIRICQTFSRFLNKPGYEYSPMIFEIVSLSGMELLSQGENKTNHGGKSVNCNQRGFIDVKPGRYMIRLIMFWRQQLSIGNLCAYFCQSISFKRMTDFREAENLWLKAMSNKMSKQPLNTIQGQNVYNLSWMKGQLLMYFKSDKPETRITFTFTPSKLSNCAFGKNCIPQESKLQIKSGEVGTIQKLVIKEACSTGSFTIVLKSA